MQSLRFFAKVAGVLVVGIPVFAQSPDATSDILKGVSHPPLHRIIRPNATPDAGPTGIFPGKMKVAYGLNNIKNYGKGQVIAIVDAYDDPNAEADLGTFSTQFGLPACTTANGCFKKVMESGTPADTTGWSNEIAIDTQWAHAIAPQARIILVEAKNNGNSALYSAVSIAVKYGASVVSMSWGGGEASNESTTDSYFNVPNVTMLASSGDGGHGVSYPAASPYVVGVGGTSLTINSSVGAYVSETAWSDSGGGVSSYEPEPVYQGGVQSTGMRGVPDVAFDADPNTGVPAYNSYACKACYTGWDQWGGTSISAPQWAGIIAITNSMRVAAGKTNLSQVQFLLYPLAEADYHDITSGTNGTCGSVCTAGTGYDFVTGVGSPKANLLIPALVATP
ncbi:MAG TPA: S53 family peptidase [Bryobacteraceae bacterium]|nr:S53 family peptidase [Bryobacteraceae bacterium]